jgi:hypothetical protein
MASQLRKAKPRSILASDSDLPRCHQRHMEGRREGITPALFRNKAAQFLSSCRRGRRSVSRSLVSCAQAPTAAKQPPPSAMWGNQLTCHRRYSVSRAVPHPRRFYHLQSICRFLYFCRIHGASNDGRVDLVCVRRAPFAQLDYIDAFTVRASDVRNDVAPTY